MKRWQSSRNYRKIRRADGSVKYIITVDGVDVEVTNDVFTVYSRMDRRERYLEERDSKVVFLSIDKMLEDGTNIDKHIPKPSPSAEYVAVTNEDEAELAALLGRLPDAMARLNEKERELVRQIYITGISLREYSKSNEIPTMTVHYRLQKVLKKLKNYLS